jgi:hypothetical protein
MTEKQENRIIEQAHDILEARGDERALRFALENDVKIDLHRVVHYGAYYHGALDAALHMMHELEENKPKSKDDWIYQEAVWRLATKSKRNMELYLNGEEIRYRNHETAKNGKLKSVEAYFAERVTIIREKT